MESPCILKNYQLHSRSRRVEVWCTRSTYKPMHNGNIYIYIWYIWYIYICMHMDDMRSLPLNGANQQNCVNQYDYVLYFTELFQISVYMMGWKIAWFWRYCYISPGTSESKWYPSWILSCLALSHIHVSSSWPAELKTNGCSVSARQIDMSSNITCFMSHIICTHISCVLICFGYIIGYQWSPLYRVMYGLKRRFLALIILCNTGITPG